MALDHYIPQVHLRRFYSPSLSNQLYGIRKIDCKQFPARSGDVCRTPEGSTNHYLSDHRAIEEFLKTIEPFYNEAVEQLSSGHPSKRSIYTIAGYVAYVMSCSPGGMRIDSAPLKTSVEAVAEILDTKGLLPAAPDSLGKKSLTELISNGTVEVAVDPKYPQALGIKTILERTATFGNFEWEAISNDYDSSPFFTSDYPVAIETSEDPRVLNLVAPLTPTLCIRIRPDFSAIRKGPDPDFPRFRLTCRTAKHEEVRKFNRAIVQCAETTVFFRDPLPWVRPFVEKYHDYRIVPTTKKIRVSGKTLLIATKMISRWPSNSTH